MPQNNAENIEIKEVELSLDKRYKLPSQIATIEYDGDYLIINTEGINWIVLNNENELSVFRGIQNEHSIAEMLEAYDEESVSNVVRQIEARRFDDSSHPEQNERNMYVLLTNRCNQRCRHCYMFAGEREYDELSIAQWKSILNEFRNNGGTGVTFTGGEITVYNGYADLIEHAHNTGLSVTILSNGTQWTEKTIREISPFLDEVQISLDGYDAASYFKVRQHDGFDRALESVRLFHEAGVKVSIAVAPLLDDLDNFLISFERFARKFQALYPDIFIKLNYELINGREVSLSPAENKRYKEKMMSLVERLYPDHYVEMFALNYMNKQRRKNCGFGEMSIAPNGDVFWCNRIPELTPAKNVARDSFEEIVAQSEWVKQETSVDNTIPCQTCDIRYICGGGCRLEYENIEEAGSHPETWNFHCPGKDAIYKKMILSNEYFFEM